MLLEPGRGDVCMACGEVRNEILPRSVRSSFPRLSPERKKKLHSCTLCGAQLARFDWARNPENHRVICRNGCP